MTCLGQASKCSFATQVWQGSEGDLSSFPMFPCSCQFLLCYCSFRSCRNQLGEQFPAPDGKSVKLLLFFFFSPGLLCLLPLWSLPPLRAWFPLSSGLLQEPLSFLFLVYGAWISFRKQLFRSGARWVLLPTNCTGCQTTKIASSVIFRGERDQRWHCNEYSALFFSRETNK